MPSHSTTVASPPSGPIQVGDVIPSIVPPAVPTISVGSPPTTTPIPSISVGSPPAVPTISVGSPPTIHTPSPSISVASPPIVPTISVGSPPTTNTPIPSISVGSPPTPSTPTITVAPLPAGPSIIVDASPRLPPPSPPGVAFSGVPTIEVESGDTRDANTRGPSRIEPTAAILCAGCTHPIIGRIVSAMGRRWHPPCFQCGECGGALEHVSAYEHDGKPYCHLDYHDRFAHKCHHCRTPIVDARFITLDNELGVRYYHELHFFCSECGDPFLDPSKSSAAGTEHNAEGADETSDFVIHKGHPYCERCHVRLHKPRCKACRAPIPDVAVSAMGAKWHTGCFVCATCTHPFANNLFFPRDGKAYCTECFERMN
ncbi:LIM-domain-containing protein [Cutaneotrichosporon oleaginosum]|uniref:LIM-domain-containing protein n=1 Tax=Cutaneotrichosporon oleaginosum TaxID=879819 RepID=A0A0J0XB22_9TREE|nr:LIM-domain-containing protein [Cutaneotrichosporon oleaginosum]KLT38307.1 LIM-domain-containing protein [Cutaneotrichosporon oleaginosum]TXT07011.1 hypothetical protein COLE_06342 [Cutaneotrichosporon oleaginosum]